MTSLAAPAAVPLPSAPSTNKPAPSMKRVAGASLAGTTLEFYDHFIYGSAAALVFPNMAVCREISGLTDPDRPAHDVVTHPAVVARFQAVFDDLARQATGSSTFVARALLLDVPPSLDAREITDKGSLNQKVVLQNRAALVDDLYATPPPAHVIVCNPTKGAATRTR